ncbi:discoidin domain-containing protein [Paenibacillus plantarum]|nr:discoidin domain-containing protein [Paenibacillus plantarum]
MKKKAILSLNLVFTLAFSMLAIPGTTALASGSGGAVQVTYSSYNNNSGNYKLSVQPSKTLAQIDNTAVDATIQVDPSITYQSFVGFGGTMLNSDVYELNRLSATDKTNALKALVDPNVGNNYNLMRLTIGCSDACSSFDTTKPDNGFWSYDDNGGIADPNLTNFSIQKDIDAGTIATLQQMLAINPNLKFFASIWSPPGWMKDNNSMIITDQQAQNGLGHVLPQYYGTLANYFVKYIQAYANLGIPIYTVSLANEPNVPRLYPTTLWTASEQADFAVTLGQAFAANGIKTKIWSHDDNETDTFNFAEPVLKNANASAYIDGVGFHNYGGQVLVHPSMIHYQYPDKTLHVTEITNGSAQLVEYFRNWISSYDYWLSFAEFMPGPGPGFWQQVSSNDNPDFWTDTQLSWAGTPGNSTFKLNAYYYTFGQFSRFIQPGAVRIDSSGTQIGNISNVAFKNPDGTIVMVVVNRIPDSHNSTFMNTPAKTIKIATPDGQIVDTIPGDTVATYRWTPNTGEALTRSGWTASASLTNSAYSATQAIDDSTETLWNSGANQANGQSFSLNLGSAQTFDQISLNQGSLYGGDSPGSYQVFTSNDGVNWGSAVASGIGSNGMTNISFGSQTKQHIKIQLTGSATRGWTIANVSLFNSKNGILPTNGWTASASSTEQNGSASKALDGNLETRWSNGTAPAPGQWFQVDMGATRTFNKIDMNTGPSVGDYPRGYSVSVSNDGVNWGTPIATGVGIGQDNLVSFPSQTARYIKVTQTGSASNVWWSIAEFHVYNQNPLLLNRSGWTAIGSPDPNSSAANTLDNNLTTRWTNGSAPAPGQWFQIDMKKINTISGIELNAATSIGDYPPGYEVNISMDGTNWKMVAKGSIPAQDNVISFPVDTARYIKVTQTGSSTNSWWSIHEFNVFGVQMAPSVGNPINHSGWTATASVSGSGSPSNAIDGTLGTAWRTGSSQAGNEFFQIDLGSTQSFSMVELNAAPLVAGNPNAYPTDAPANYEVYVSNGGAWTLVAQGSTTGQPITRIKFPTQNARFINVHQTGVNAWHQWTIGEFNVYH